jgi:hypothetical protein
LFGDEGVDEFDKIDLRAEQNYACSTGASNNSMVREVFSRDTQKDMDQPYTRSRYYHLYINGMYWGLFQSQERSEARLRNHISGDDEEDYDVVKVDTEKDILLKATTGRWTHGRFVQYVQGLHPMLTILRLKAGIRMANLLKEER